MAKIRDRTEDFKDAIRTSAVSYEYTESKLAAIMASFIMQKLTHRTPFTKAALKTRLGINASIFKLETSGLRAMLLTNASQGQSALLSHLIVKLNVRQIIVTFTFDSYFFDKLKSINELEHFILKHQKDYLNLHRTTEQERDSIEHEVSVCVKAIKEHIDFLKNRIYDEEKNENATKWLPIFNDSSHADEVAHKHGVVLILSERLHSVTAKFDQLRSVRIQEAISRAMPRRKKHAFPTTKSPEVLKSDFTELVSDKPLTEPILVQNQILDDETQALQVELTNMLDAVRVTETKMVEVSALSHLMSTHVLQQAQQIEILYEQAVEATKNVTLGNKELRQAIQRNSSSRTFLLLFFFVLTFSVIFLDWYS